MSERRAPMEDPGAGPAGDVLPEPGAVPPPRRPEARHPEVHRISSGHFHEGPAYDTYRHHGTTDWLLIHTVSGSGRFASADGTRLRTTAGDAVLLRPGARHDYGTAPGTASSGSASWEIGFSHFHPRREWLPLLEWPQPVPGVGRVRAEGEVHRRITAALRRSARTGGGALARAELFALNALEEALLWCDTQNPRSGQTDERVLRAVEFVDAHLTGPLDVRRVAEAVHLSPSRLTRLFGEHLHTTPQRYLEQQRIALAKQLLDLTARPIAVVARQSGWTDPLYFSQRFRRATGLSPTAYRRRR